jgi:hypothetical protein
MRATYSYESILRAVGRQLDRGNVGAIALRETADGLTIEGVNRDSQARVTLAYELADLAAMVDDAEGHFDTLFDGPVTIEARELPEFLARHSTVLAR